MVAHSDAIVCSRMLLARLLGHREGLSECMLFARTGAGQQAGSYMLGWGGRRDDCGGWKEQARSMRRKTKMSSSRLATATKMAASTPRHERWRRLRLVGEDEVKCRRQRSFLIESFCLLPDPHSNPHASAIHTRTHVT